MINARVAALGLLSCCAAQAGAASPLVVHEWGTFTSFQDAVGRTIAGINVDDEPVPAFVHRLGSLPVFQSTSLPATWSQGAPSCHPAVTLRLETPVMYFYPPADWTPAAFDVRATFNGGWLTEFFPAAKADAGQFPNELTANTRGSLHWQSLQLDPGATMRMPQTTAGVWLAPRNVAAELVSDPHSREAEKYLFYRGVGHLEAPVVIRERNGGWDVALRGHSALANLPRVWIVEVMPDGRVRYQSSAVRGHSLHVPAFPKSPTDAGSGLAALRGELTTALEAEGLFADEAAAMLATWKLSYFESPGLRVFFLLPQSWTDAQLPLSISTPAQVTRVMVGRVELVTAGQREALGKLQALSLDAFPRLPLYYHDNRALKASNQEGRSLSQLYEFTGREVPESLRLYESLGRFRDALMVHTLQSSSDDSRRAILRRAIAAYSACIPAEQSEFKSAQSTSGK
jgi:hypothetical protein